MPQSLEQKLFNQIKKHSAKMIQELFVELDDLGVCAAAIADLTLRILKKNKLI